MATAKSAQKQSTQDPYTVGSIAAAMRRRREYPEAHGFVVAPLKTKTGARSWHGIDAKKMAWDKLGTADVSVPSIDAGDEVPQLPKSELNLWEIAFVDAEAEIIRPSLLIDPRQNVATETQKARDEAAGAQPDVGSPATGDGGEGKESVISVLLELSKAKDRHCLLLLQGAQQVMNSAGAQSLGLVDHYRKALEGAQGDRDATLQQLRDLVATNSDLSNQLQVAQQDGQLHQTIREVFAGKPELLVDSAKGLVIAILEKLKS